MEDMEAQIVAWHDEQKHADGVTKLMTAELRAATRNVHEVRAKIKAKHRVRVGGGLQHGQGELRYLAEAEADSFREKIAAELQIQLQDLPIKEVPRVINQILKTESAEKDTGYTTDAIRTITKLQHRVKRTILRRRLLAAAVAENARRHTGTALAGPLQTSFNREQTYSGTRLDSGDDRQDRQDSKRHTASREHSKRH